MEVITIRPAEKADLSFIYATMLRSLFYGCPDFYGKIQKDTFFSEYERVVTHLLQTSALRVACLTEDPEVIIGYSISSAPVVHFVYVKEAHRKQGIAKALLGNEDYSTCTHITKIGDSIRKKKGWMLNPWRI